MENSTCIRIDNNHQTYEVDKIGSNYINYLHLKLELAKQLAEEVASLNSKCLSIGAGKMAALQNYANQILI